MKKLFLASLIVLISTNALAIKVKVVNVAEAHKYDLVKLDNQAVAINGYLMEDYIPSSWQAKVAFTKEIANKTYNFKLQLNISPDGRLLRDTQFNGDEFITINSNDNNTSKAVLLDETKSMQCEVTLTGDKPDLTTNYINLNTSNCQAKVPTILPHQSGILPWGNSGNLKSIF